MEILARDPLSAYANELTQNDWDNFAGDEVDLAAFPEFDLLDNLFSELSLETEVPSNNQRLNPLTQTIIHKRVKKPYQKAPRLGFLKVKQMMNNWREKNPDQPIPLKVLNRETRIKTTDIKRYWAEIAQTQPVPRLLIEKGRKEEIEAALKKQIEK